jgi:NAD(P)-dependent dehydrogenase (short-subunit alcohol dehydrogenase family)
MEAAVNKYVYQYSTHLATSVISNKLSNPPADMASSSFFPSLTKLSHSESYPAISPSRPELSVKGKTVVITGGGSGIGASIAKAFAAGGSTKIAIVSRTKRNLLATKHAIEEEFIGTEVLAVPADITNVKQVNDAFLKINQTFGKIDVLVCNSAFMPAPRPVLSPDFDVQDWWTAFNTNILGALHTVKGFVRYAAEGAHILHISTCIGHIPPLEAGVSAYAASKAAAAKLFDYIAFENPELHVVNVHPGLVDTDMSRKSGHGGMDHSEYPDISLLPPPAPFLSLHEISQALCVTIEDETDSLAVDLSGHFCLWLVSSEADFLRGKFVWVNWDVDELKARKEEILSTDLLDTKLGGVSFVGWEGVQTLGGL